MLSEFALEGHGVRLEPLALGHVEGLAKAAAGDRDSYGYTWVPDGPAQARSYVEQALAARDSGRQVPFAVRDLGPGEIAGTTRLLDLDVFAWPPPWPPGIAAGPSRPTSSRRRPRRSAPPGTRRGRSGRTSTPPASCSCSGTRSRSGGPGASR